MKALIIVDLQNDFLPGGSLPVPEGDELIPVINALLEHFPLILATKDWHPLDHCSFNEQGGIWPVHCVQGTHGAEFPSGFFPKKVNKVFFKGIDKEVDSYSGFFDNDKKHSTGLDEYLKKKGIDTLFIVGLATEFCVKHTVIDACLLGYHTFVIKKGCKGLGDSEAAFAEMEKVGATIIPIDHV